MLGTKTSRFGTKNSSETIDDSRLPKKPYDSFLEYEKAKGLTSRALGVYTEKLPKALKVVGDPYLAKEEDIIRYLNTIPGNQYGYGNRLAHFRVLRTFYKYLESKGFQYPMKNVPVPRVDEEAVMPTLRLNDIRRLMDLTDTRGKLLLALPAASALRKAEYANINVEDIDWSLKAIKVKTKTQKSTLAPIGFAEPYLKAYLQESGIKSGNIWQSSRKWGSLNYWGITQFNRRLELKARKLFNNPSFKANPHTLRRAFAVINKELKVPDSIAMANGRWKNPKMYKKYSGAYDLAQAIGDWNKISENLLENLALPKIQL